MRKCKNEKGERGRNLLKKFGSYGNSLYLCSEKKKQIMKLTKEEALKRFKKALNRKKAWEEKFDAKYADVTNLYATAQRL